MKHIYTQLDHIDRYLMKHKCKLFITILSSHMKSLNR